MSTRGYIGQRAGDSTAFYVPERFRDSWRRDGGRIVSQLSDEFEDERPVALARAVKARKQIESVVIAPAVAVPSADGAIATDENPKRKRR